MLGNVRMFCISPIVWRDQTNRKCIGILLVGQFPSLFRFLGWKIQWLPDFGGGNSLTLIQTLINSSSPNSTSKHSTSRPLLDSYCWWKKSGQPVEVGTVVYLIHYLQGFIHPWWLFGISEPSTVSTTSIRHTLGPSHIWRTPTKPQ